MDWYQQRAEACSDDALKAVLTHNKNEEIEHAMMTLEWLRRHHPVFATNIGVRTHRLRPGPITAVEASTNGGAAPVAEGAAPQLRPLPVGSASVA